MRNFSLPAIMRYFVATTVFAAELVFAGVMIVESAYAKDEAVKAAVQVRPPRPKPRVRSVASEIPGEAPKIRREATSSEQAAAKPQPLSEAIDVVVLLDNSRSMQRNDAGKLQAQAVKLLLTFLDDNDKLSLVSYDRTTQEISPFAELAPDKIDGVEKIVEQMTLTGTHTDHEAPIRKAFDILLDGGRSEAKRIVVLFSDGKFDPHQERGLASELRARMLEFDLPLLTRSGARVFTFSLTDETDTSLMDQIALIGLGNHWIAKDINAIHKRLSEMFLEIKRPDSLSGRGNLVVKPGTKEATFYINRASTGESVGLIDPRANVITNTDIPLGVRWFKGEDFDVVSVDNPNVGAWGLDKRQAPSATAVILDDFKFEVKATPQAVIGDQITIATRLTNRNEPVTLPGLIKSSFVSYKIANKDSGGILTEGLLNESSSEDGTHSIKLTLAEAGNFQITTNLVTPTFSKVASFSLAVSSGLLQLEEARGDVAAAKPTLVNLTLGQKVSLLSDTELEVQFVGPEGNQEIVKVELTGEDKYQISTINFPAGTYSVVATLKGKSSDGTTITSRSEQLKIEVIAKPEVEVAPEVERKKKLARKPLPELPKQEPMWPGFTSLILTLAWLAGIFIYAKKKYAIEVEEETLVVKPFELPGHIQRQIALLREKSSKEKRELTERELLIFSGVPLKQGEDGHEIILEAEGQEDLEIAVTQESGEALEQQTLSDNEAQTSLQGELSQEIDAAVAEIDSSTEGSSEAEIASSETADEVSDSSAEDGQVSGVSDGQLETSSSDRLQEENIETGNSEDTEDEVSEDVQEEAELAAAGNPDEELVEQSTDEDLAAIDRLIDEINAQG